MTDNEIRKAKSLLKKLEEAYEAYYNTSKGMPYDIDETLRETAICLENALGEITRQKAEIERLCMEIDELIISKDQLFDEAEALIKKARAEAIKEFWNQRPPQLNNQDGKNLYNQGWNDCISFFAEEYKIILGIKKRSEEMVGDV